MTSKGVRVERWSPVAGLPGIPRFANEALGQFILGSSLGVPLNDRGQRLETCGIFLMLPEGWSLERGWKLNLMWVQTENLSKEEGTTEMSMDSVAASLNSVAARTRRIIGEKFDWLGIDPESSWTNVVRAETAALWSAMGTDEKANLPVDVNTEVEYFNYLVDSKLEGADGALEGADALEYAQEDLVNPILGFGHTHPNGVAEVSPQDLLAAKTVVECNRIYNEIAMSRSRSGGNFSGLFGNWIAVIDPPGSEVGSLLRFDSRGRTGKWSGDFTK